MATTKLTNHATKLNQDRKAMVRATVAYLEDLSYYAANADVQAEVAAKVAEDDTNDADSLMHNGGNAQQRSVYLEEITVADNVAFLLGQTAAGDATKTPLGNDPLDGAQLKALMDKLGTV